MMDDDTAEKGKSGMPGQTLGQAGADVKQTLAQTATAIKDAATEQTGVLKEKASAALEGAQAKAADQARSAAASIRQAAASLDPDLPWMSAAMNKASDGLEGLTEALSSGDVRDALSAVEGFARRQPALFLGLSVAAGFALARVGKTALKPSQTSGTATGQGENGDQAAGQE